MSVGGKVIEVMDQYDLIWINTLDGNDECAIYVMSDEDSRRVKEGDCVWWQGGFAYWTADSEGAKEDVSLTRVGSSGVNRPEPTAISVMQKERQKLIDESKGLECEIRDLVDKYEYQINMARRLKKEAMTRESNFRIYSGVISVIAFVSTYLHFS